MSAQQLLLLLLQRAPALKKFGRKKMRLVLSRKVEHLSEETVLRVGYHRKSHIIANSNLCATVATNRVRRDAKLGFLTINRGGLLYGYCSISRLVSFSLLYIWVSLDHRCIVLPLRARLIALRKVRKGTKIMPISTVQLRHAQQPGAIRP